MTMPIKLKFLTYKVCPHCEGMCIDCFDAAIREAEERGEIRGLEESINLVWAGSLHTEQNCGCGECCGRADATIAIRERIRQRKEGL